MSHVYLTINGSEVNSREALEGMIADLPEESKAALRGLFDEAVSRLDIENP